MIARLQATDDALPQRRAIDGLVVGLALAAAGWAGVAGEPVPLVGWVAALSLAAVGLHPRFGRDARVAAWVAAGFAILLAVRLPPVWPLVQLAFLVPVALAVAAIPALRPAREHLGRGRLDALPVLLLGGMAAVALTAWVQLLEPDLAALRAFVPAWPAPLLALGLVGFSVVNALLEEVAFRGLLQGALTSLLGVEIAIVLQAALFGLAHWHGFPSGPLGAAMAGSWALLLGWARHRTGGLITPVLAHIAADAVIFALLATAA